MSRTDLDPATLAKSLRRMAGDGSVEWVTGPMQVSVLLDIADMLDENAKLREQMERLVTLLRVDCDIDASWDGLRRFWSIELTESGCLMRDRACKAETENAKLRELVRIAGTYCVNGLCGMDDGCPLYLGKPYCALHDRMRELGIEVDG